MKRLVSFLLILVTAALPAFGAYDQILVIDTSSKLIEVMMRSDTTGQPLTGLAVGAVTVSYMREGASAAIALGAPAVLTTLGTWETDAWKETEITGVYQYGIPNACLVTGSNAVTLVFTGTAAITTKCRIVLTAANLQNATSLGLTNLNDTITSRLASASYTAERGTDNALLASNYATERGTDSALLASSYTPERGTDSALLASSYTPERGTDSALLASNYVTERGTDGASTHSAADVTALILASPTQKLATDANGYVTSSNERGTDSAMLASSYVTERGTDNALLAVNYVTERGTDAALLAANYTPERGTNSAMLATSYVAPDNANIGFIKTAVDLIKIVADKLATMYEGSGPYHYTAASLVHAPTGGDATAANQTTILDELALLQGTTFSTLTDSNEAIRNRGDEAWTTGTLVEDKILVDHNTGGADAMRVTTSGGTPISDVMIRAYVKADYDAGIYTLRGKTTTNATGRWRTPLYLDDAVPYTLVFEKSGEYGPSTAEVTP